MTKNEIKKIILKELGNPVSGKFAGAADRIAEAIHTASTAAKEEKKPEVKAEAEKETRVVSAEETR